MAAHPWQETIFEVRIGTIVFLGAHFFGNIISLEEPLCFLQLEEAI